MDGYKITNANNIMLGNNQVNLYIGSNKIWDSTEQKSFSFMPIVMDSDANLKLSWEDSYAAVGNSTFIIKPTNNTNLNEINIAYRNINSKVRMLKFDDYALCVNRYYNHNSWPGGTTSGVYEEYIDLSLDNQTKTVKIFGKGDENNQIFMSGMFVNKVIKVPSCGTSGVVKVQFFPYSFDDEFYSMKTFRLMLLDYNDTTYDRKNLYVWNNDNQTFKHNTTGAIKTLDDTIFSSLNVSYYGLIGTIEYTIKPNNTNEFRDIALCTMDSMVHFVQESHNDHRIYIGFNNLMDTEYIDNPTGEQHEQQEQPSGCGTCGTVGYSDITYTNGEQPLGEQESYGVDYYTSGEIGTPEETEPTINESEYLFHLSGSKIINRSTQIIVPISASIIYPESLENEYDIIIEGRNTLTSNTYTWDNMTFKRYNVYTNKTDKIIFKKK